MGEPVYGELISQGYLEYMASGVIISITYIMATGLTALAFILGMVFLNNLDNEYS